MFGSKGTDWRLVDHYRFMCAGVGYSVCVLVMSLQETVKCVDVCIYQTICQWSISIVLVPPLDF